MAPFVVVSLALVVALDAGVGVGTVVGISVVVVVVVGVVISFVVGVSVVGCTAWKRQRL